VRFARLAWLLACLSITTAAACGDDDGRLDPDASVGPDAPSLVCPDPEEAWDWPLPQEPVTIAPDASWKHDVTFEDAFRSPYTASDGRDEVRWIKFAVLLGDPTQVYFQDSTAYPFHYEFATAKLDPFLGLSREDFDRRSLHVAGQEVALGVALFPPRAGVAELGVQLVGEDPYPPEMVRRVLALVSAHVSGREGFRTIYMPAGAQLPCASAAAGWFAEHGVEVDGSDRWVPGNACYAPGWAIGRLTQVAAGDVDRAYLDGTLRPSDILLTGAVSAEVPYLAGILTTEPSTPSSHVAILSRAYGVPFAYLRDDELAAQAAELVGREVVVTTAENYVGGCDVRLIDVSAVPAADREAIRALAQPPPVAFPPKASAGMLVRDVDDVGPADVATVGGKAAHFGLLRDAIPDESPHAVALTFDVWDAFLAQPDPGGGTLGEHVAARLASFTWPPDFAALDARLAEVRARIEAAPFPESLRPGIEAGLAGFDPTVRLRFRSSTNVEDGESFTGAGLYDSVSGCLADDTDDDAFGPSRCDAAKPEERGIYRAIGKVYASFYARNAFLERLRRGVDPTRVGMAVLVHPSYPDENELANGVATLGRSTTSSVITMVSQAGAVSVTNPDGRSLPEVVSIDVYEFGTYLSPREGSTLLPLGAHVLAWEDEYRSFTDLFGQVADRYGQVTGSSSFLLDYEYKKIAPDQLVVKQVRPLPQPDRTRDVVPFLVGTPITLCAFEGEYGDVWAIHRLKSTWRMSADDRWLSSLGSSFWTGAEIDRLAGAAVVRLSGAPSSFAGASHAVAGELVTDAFDVAGARLALSTTVIPLVQRNEAPVVTPDRFYYGLTATYAAQVPVLDWQGPTTRTEETVRLSTICPDTTVLQSGSTRQDRTMAGPGGLQVVTSFWFPPPPGGATAGYTAPLVKWEETTISGLASVPIVLRGGYAQSYRPFHHNFDGEYLFEPRLEPGIAPGLVAELEAADVRRLYVTEAGSIWIEGTNGALRRLQ